MPALTINPHSFLAVNLNRAVHLIYFKNMKKLVFLFTLVATMALCPACSDNEPDNSLASDMIGSWRCTMLRTSEDEPWHSWNLEDTYLTFNADHTFVSVGYFGNGKGSWSKSGNILSCNADNGSSLRLRVLESSSSNMTMRATSLFGTIYITTEKIIK